MLAVVSICSLRNVQAVQIYLNYFGGRPFIVSTLKVQQYITVRTALRHNENRSAHSASSDSDFLTDLRTKPIASRRRRSTRYPVRVDGTRLVTAIVDSKRGGGVSWRRRLVCSQTVYYFVISVCALSHKSVQYKQFVVESRPCSPRRYIHRRYSQLTRFNDYVRKRNSAARSKAKLTQVTTESRSVVSRLLWINSHLEKMLCSS